MSVPEITDADPQGREAGGDARAIASAVQRRRGRARGRRGGAVPDRAGREGARGPAGEAVWLAPLIHHLAINIIREVVFGADAPKGTDELIDVLEQRTEFTYKIASTLMM